MRPSGSSSLLQFSFDVRPHRTELLGLTGSLVVLHVVDDLEDAGQVDVEDVAYEPQEQCRSEDLQVGLFSLQLIEEAVHDAGRSLDVRVVELVEVDQTNLPMVEMAAS